jgi:aminopeptidase N
MLRFSTVYPGKHLDSTIQNRLQPSERQKFTTGTTCITDDNSKVSNTFTCISFTGFYRVNYDLRNWRLLTEYLMDRDHFTQIGIINRAQLLDDALNLARAGLLDYATALDVTRYLANELEYIPWKAALNALGYIDSMFVKTGNYDKFKVCICNVYSA